MKQHRLGERQRELLKALAGGPLRVNPWSEDLKARLIELGLARERFAELELTPLGVRAVHAVRDGVHVVQVIEPPSGRPGLRSARTGAPVRR